MGQSASKQATIADQKINETLNKNEVVIFSKKTCGYCDAVKQVMNQETKKLQKFDMCTVSNVAIVELDGDGDMQNALYKLTGVATVPQVFVNNQFLGGAVDTAKLANVGQLRLALIDAAGCRHPSK